MTYSGKVFIKIEFPTYQIEILKTIDPKIPDQEYFLT